MHTPPDQSHLPPEEYLAIADKVRTGQYFREARTMYDTQVHDPMAERYFYIFITVVAAFIFTISLAAVSSLYPLKSSVPFIFNANDLAEEMPRIKSLLNEKGEDPSEALLRFMVRNYVTARETYSIESFDRNTNGVKSQSSEKVLGEFQAGIDPRNPESPIAQYQRHSRRNINILGSRRLLDQDFGMEVIFEAVVESRTDTKKSRWQADVAFEYNGIELDEETGKVSPIEFVVTDYRVKRLQD